jgi:hypothetical protein
LAWFCSSLACLPASTLCTCDYLPHSRTSSQQHFHTSVPSKTRTWCCVFVLPLSRLCANQSRSAGWSCGPCPYLHHARATQAPRGIRAPLSAVGVRMCLLMLFHTTHLTQACMPVCRSPSAASGAMANAMQATACITSTYACARLDLFPIELLQLQLVASVSCLTYHSTHIQHILSL